MYIVYSGILVCSLAVIFSAIHSFLDSKELSEDKMSTTIYDFRLEFSLKFLISWVDEKFSY